MLLLYGGGGPSCVSCVLRVAINVHITTIWWRGALMCGSCVSHVLINVQLRSRSRPGCGLDLEPWLPLRSRSSTATD